MVKKTWLAALALVVVGVIAVQAACGAVISIVSPEEGARVKGEVELRATVALGSGEEIEGPVAQTIDGCRIPLVRGGDGLYSGTIDTAKLPNGRQTLMVLATPKGRDERRDGYADAAWGGEKFISIVEVAVVVRNPYHHYWGDIHAHTSYSDGAWYPKEAYEYARDAAELDFFAVTDHLEILTMEEYADVVAQAHAADEPGRFVALYGVERTREETGHINFYMSPTHILPTDLNDFFRAIGRMGLLAHFNHPTMEPTKGGERHNDFQQFRYDPAADECMAMVELRSPEEEECYIAMLDSGWHVGAVGDQDKHSPTWGDGPTWTVALARELTREGILDALRSRRTYSSADRNLRLDFTFDGEDMGSRIARPAGEYACTVTVSDPDADGVVQRVDLFLDGEVVRTAEPGEASCEWEVPVTLSAGAHYCFVRVTQPDERTAWSSPIWVSAY